MKNLKIKFIILLASLFSAVNLYSQNNCTNSCSANGGGNKTICCPGGTVSIGNGPNCGSNCGASTYQWSPTTGLSSPTSCVTNASPTVTTTYTLTVTFPASCCCAAPTGQCITGGTSTCPQVNKTATVTVSVNTSCCRLIKPENEKELTNNEINLFPNPTEEKFSLQFYQINAGTCVIIYDANGKMVKVDENISVDNKQISYDLSSQAKGIYYIKIVEGENTVYFKKLILQ